VFAGRRCGVALWATQQLYAACAGRRVCRGLAHGRAAALNLDGKLGKTGPDAFNRSQPERRNWILLVWKLKGRLQNNPPSWRKRFLMRAPRGICIWRLGAVAAEMV